MNIYSNNSVYGRVNVLNYSNNPLKMNKMNMLSVDTVSFGASVNMRKRIEELKTYNPSGNHSIKRAEAEKIYEYFGFLKKSENTHIKYEGPYGQTIIIKRQNPIDAGAANDLINAIKRADKFNGELIIFGSEPSSSDIEKWTKIISERSPQIGYVNQYAIDLKTQNDSGDTSTDEIQNAGKGDDRKLNDLKKQINLFLTKVSNAEKDISNLEANFTKLQADCSSNGLSVPKSEFTKVEEQLEAEKERTKSAKETVLGFKDKLSVGKELSEEEQAELHACMQESFGFEDLKSSLNVLEESCINALDKKDDLCSKVSSLINLAGEKVIDYELQLDEIKHLMSEAAICRCMMAQEFKMLEEKVAKFEKEFNETKKQVERHEKINLETKSTNRLESIQNNLSSLFEGTISRQGKELQKIQEIVNQKIVPFVTYSPKDFARIRQKRLDDFNRRASVVSNSEQKRNAANVEPSKNVDVPKELPPLEDNENVIVHEAPKAQPQIEEPKISSQISVRESKVSSFKEKLTAKTSPLPIKSIQAAMSELIDKEFDINAFSTIQTGKDGVQNFVNDIIAKIAKTPEYKKVKNASKLAFIEALSKSSSKIPEQIYSLPVSQLKLLYKQIEAGKKELEFFTPIGMPMNFTLERDVNLKEIEQKFGEYNVLLKDIDSKETGKIVDTILSYAPILSHQETQNLMLYLLNEGSYLKVLTNETVAPEIKSSVLESFWKNYDNTYSTNYTVQVLENFKEEQQRKIEAEMQRKKLDSVDKIDWSL